MPAVVITSSVTTAVVAAEQAAKNGHGRSDTSWLAGWEPGGAAQCVAMIGCRCGQAADGAITVLSGMLNACRFADRSHYQTARSQT